jgi:hypothetical protein
VANGIQLSKQMVQFHFLNDMKKVDYDLIDEIYQKKKNSILNKKNSKNFSYRPEGFITKLKTSSNGEQSSSILDAHN